MRGMPAHHRHRHRPGYRLLTDLTGLSLAVACLVAQAEGRLAGQEGPAQARLNFQVVIPSCLALDLTATLNGHAAAKGCGQQRTTLVVKARSDGADTRSAWMYTALAL